MNATSRSETDTYVIESRNRTAQHIIRGFAHEFPALDYFWRYVTSALADVPPLLAELADARLRRANLVAAVRAAIAASQDGEGDPWYYVRDELDAQAQELPGENGEGR